MSQSPFICPRVEAALASLIDVAAIQATYYNAEGESVTRDLEVYTGLEHATVNDSGEQSRRDLPCAECVCQSSQFDAQKHGSHVAQAVVIVRGNADDMTDAAFANLVDSVFSLLVTDSIAADLTDVGTDFHCGSVIWQSQGWQIAGRSWIAELEGEFHCAGRTVAES